MTRQKLLQLGWEALIYLLYSDTAPLDGLFKILLMKKNSIPWKTVKGHWNSSLFKKIKKKNWGRWNYEVAWKKAEGSGTKWWTCSIKFLVKMKNRLLFLLRKQRKFLANPIKEKRPAHFFFFGHTACGILVPQTEIQPVTLAVEAQSPNHWMTREFPIQVHF